MDQNQNGDPVLEATAIDVFVNKDPYESEPDSTTIPGSKTTDPDSGNIIVAVPAFSGTPTVYIRATFLLEGGSLLERKGKIVKEDPRGGGILGAALTGVESNTQQTPEGNTAHRGRRWDLVSTTKLRDSQNNPRNQRVDIAKDGKSATVTFAVQLLGSDFKKNNSFTITAYATYNEVFGPNGKLNNAKVISTSINVEFQIRYHNPLKKF